MRDILIEFMDSIREYVAESGTNIAHDERESSEFVDIFLNQGRSLPIDSVSECDHSNYRQGHSPFVACVCNDCGQEI